MKIRKLKMVLVLLLLCLMIVTGACSNNGQIGQVIENKGGKDSITSSSSEDSVKSEETAVSVKEDPVTITFYRPHTGTTKEEFMDMMGTEIEAKFPHVTTEFIEDKEGSKIEDVITAGEALDIVLLSISFVAEYPNYGLQYDHMDLIEKHDYDLTEMESTMIEFMQTFGNGEMYALPIFTTAFTLIYNMDIFDKFGVSYPENDMSWDEVYDLARNLTRNVDGTQYYGFGTSIGHLLRVNQFSQSYVDPKTMKPTIDTDEWRSVIENFARFYEMGNTGQGNDLLSRGERKLFTEDQTLAMYAYFNSAMVGAPDGMNLDAVRLPYFKQAPGVGSQLYPTFAGVTSISENKDIAFQILAYLTSKEMQTKFAQDGLGLPARNDPSIIEVFGQNKGNLEGKHIENFYPHNPAAIAAQTPYGGIAEKELRNAFNAVVHGEKDVVTALRDASEIAAQNIGAERGE